MKRRQDSGPPADPATTHRKGGVGGCEAQRASYISRGPPFQTLCKKFYPSAICFAMMRGHTNPAPPHPAASLSRTCVRRQIRASNDIKASITPYGMLPVTPFGMSPVEVTPFGISPVAVTPFGMSPAKTGTAKAKTSTKARIIFRIFLFLL